MRQRNTNLSPSQIEHTPFERIRDLGRTLAVACVLAVSAGVVWAGITIEVRDDGTVTIDDPDGRVTVLSDGSTPQPSPEPTPAPEPTPPTGAASLAFKLTADAWPAGSSPITLRTPTDWPDGADVLVLAWSDGQQAMVNEFALRFDAPPVALTPEQLAGLPAGDIELQALWRQKGHVFDKATLGITVPERSNPSTNPDAGADDPLAPSAGGFTMWPLHSEARRIYVASNGDDGRDGLSEETAVRTVARGLFLLRDGRGDHLLFRAGDTFEGGFGHWRWSGRNAQHPLIVGVYGEGDRPRFVTRGGGVLIAPQGSRASHVAFQGIHVLAGRRIPSQPSFDRNNIPYRESGFWWMAHGENIHLEDVMIERFHTNVVFQASEPGGIRNVTLHRCIIVNAFSHYDHAIGGHSSGLFATNVDGLTVEQSVFDHNGWAPDAENIPGSARTKYNHNLYLQYTCRNLTVRDNVIARGASYGLQLRPGGEATGNLFARNAMAMYFAWQPSRVTHNVVAESDDQSNRIEDRRGYGIEVWPCEDAVVAHNLVMNKRGSADWAGAIEVTRFGAWEVEVPEYRVAITNNTIVDWPVKHEADAIVVRTGWAEVIEHSNVLDTASGGSSEPNFVRPGFTLDDAAGGSFEDWLMEARRRPRGTWPSSLTADAINQRLFAAYTVTD